MASECTFAIIVRSSPDYIMRYNEHQRERDMAAIQMGDFIA